MADDVLKIPLLKVELPKPKPWDLVALAVALGGIAASVANVLVSGVTQPGVSVSTPLTVGFVLIQLTVCIASLLVLGKTAKEGTLHGNLFALAGMAVGLGGSMLAAALWAAA